MSELQTLIELRANAAKSVADLKEERKAITEKVTTEKRGSLTAEEAESYRKISDKIADEQKRFEELDADVQRLEAEEARSGRQDERMREIGKTTTSTEVIEPLTYQREDVRHSYFRDLAKMSLGQADEGAKERLQRHSVDVLTNKEIRKVAKVGDEYRNLDRNDGTGGYAVPPLWLMNQFIELARPGRAYANLVPTQPLPGGTDSINIPKIQTGTTTAIQTADNQTISETDLTDTYVSAGVKTIAGQQGMSIQLLDQSPIAFDELVFRDIAAAYAVSLDQQVIGGSGSAGQILGVRGTAGIQTINATTTGTLTGPTGDVALLFAAIADAIQRVQTSRYMAPDVIVMHPRRWAFFLAATDTTGRPLVVPNSAMNPLAEFGGVVAQQVVGTMHGLPVVTDPSLPTTLGVGTNQDVIHVLRSSDLVLFESSTRARVLQETRANTLTVLLQMYGFLAFTAARYPQSVVEIGGSALATPTFLGA